MGHGLPRQGSSASEPLRVLVTGGRGFLGGHVCAALRDGGHEAIALGRADGDLVEPGTAERLLAAHLPDAVVHLAAVMPGDDRLVQNPAIAGNVAVACAARRIPLFHGSSTAVLADDTPYAESKRASERAAAGGTMLRFHYPYGPGQRRGAVPGMLAQARAGGPIVAYRGWARSLCYAGDAAAAVRLLVERGERGVFDVGRDDDLRALEEVARLVCRAAGVDVPIRLAEPPAGPAPVVEIDPGPLHALGWAPAVALEEGLRRTVESAAS